MNTEIVRAVAREILHTMETTRLAEYGGPATLSLHGQSHYLNK